MGRDSGTRVEGSGRVTPGDPHLLPGSRAIGAGVTSDVDSDIDGDLREGRWDVGADQFTQ